MIESLVLIKDLSDSEKMLFQSQMHNSEKNTTTAVLLTLFFGGVGGHHYYMGNIGTGVVYTLFCWTFIPAIVAFFELFLAAERVHKYNFQIAQEAVAQIKALRPTTQAA